MSTYPPYPCGVAAFTHDLAAAVGHREIVAIVPPELQPPAPVAPGKATKTAAQIEIHHRMRREDVADHVQAARDVSRCADVAAIQHGEGVWGGPDGGYVLDFVRALEIPSVVTLHDVPSTPTPAQHAVLGELAARAAVTVTLSHAAAASLAAAYGADPARIAVIPHGVLDLPLVDPLTMKPALELDGREVILSFGLLGPGKGCERVIDALPAIAATHPTVVYAIVGTTRADLPPAVRDAYAASLAARAQALGVEERVRLVDRFVGRVELSRWLEAADVFVASTRVTETAGTGTIAYAMGAGRAVVSTPSPGAAELLADERGVLVSTGSPAELARAIGDLLSDGERRTAIGGRAYEHTRPMVWSQVGDRYRELFTEAKSGRMPRERPDPAGRSPARRMGVGAAVEPITRAAAPGAART